MPKEETLEDNNYTPTAFIWSGLSGGGEDRYLPVLFEGVEEELRYSLTEPYTGFGDADQWEKHIFPIFYQDSVATYDSISVDIRYKVKPVDHSSVDTDLDGEESIKNAAHTWYDEYSDRAIKNVRRRRRDYGFVYQVKFRVYGERCKLNLPIFVGGPSKETFREGIEEDAMIPCIAFVPDDADAEPDAEFMSVKAAPIVFRA